METVKNILWFVAASVVVVTFWSVLAAALTSWVPHAKEWRRANGVRATLAEVHRVTRKGAAWVLWVLRPLPLLVPVAQKADGTRRLVERVKRPTSARALDKAEQENPVNRKVTVDFRYAVGALALFVAAALLGVIGWVTLPAMSTSVLTTLTVVALICATVGGGLWAWSRHRRPPATTM